MGRMFRTLRAAYSHRVRLKTYEYRGRLQMQLDVGDDQIFFSWKLHMGTGGCAPLFRGEAGSCGVAARLHRGVLSYGAQSIRQTHQPEPSLAHRNGRPV